MGKLHFFDYLGDQILIERIIIKMTNIHTERYTDRTSCKGHQILKFSLLTQNESLNRTSIFSLHAQGVSP